VERESAPSDGADISILRDAQRELGIKER